MNGHGDGPGAGIPAGTCLGEYAVCFHAEGSAVKDHRVPDKIIKKIGLLILFFKKSALK
jgi:hypothetical protein